MFALVMIPILWLFLAFIFNLMVCDHIPQSYQKSFFFPDWKNDPWYESHVELLVILKLVLYS